MMGRLETFWEKVCTFMKFHFVKRCAMKQDFTGSGKGAAIEAHLVAAVVLGALLHSAFPVFALVLCMAAGLVLGALVFGLTFLAVKIFSHGARKAVVYWMGTFLLLFAVMIIATGAENIAGNLIFTAIATVGLDLGSRCLWVLFVKKRRGRAVLLCSAVSLLLLTGTVYVAGADGFVNEELREVYQSAAGTRDGIAGEVQSERQPGTGEMAAEGQTGSGTVYTAQSAVYGPEAETGLVTGTYDISFFAERDDIEGIGMQAYFDYDLTEVPLAGKVWYPKEEGTYPVLFLIHGNHIYTTPSWLGYDYLGEYLAKSGYVVVSVDENCCNELTNENDARAILLLENIKTVLTLEKDAACPFYGRLDADNIAIAGHSRGGEAVATAYLFNSYDHYPENGNVTFSYHFPIKSVIAIAPTVDQYMPVDHAVELWDVNYLLLAGAQDQDITSFMGMKQYENVRFSGDGAYIKSALYIAGANHGQFNELWGKYDTDFPMSLFLNTANFLQEEEQQTIAQIFIGTFLDVTLKNQRGEEELLRNYLSEEENLPETIYQQCFQTSDFICVADFDEDSSLKTATMEGASIAVHGLVKWTEECLSYGGGAAGQNYAAYFKWRDEEEAQIIFHFTDCDVSGRNIQFDIADRNTDRVEEGDTTPLDGQIVIEDAAGEEATLQISSYSVVYPPLPVQLYKVDALTDQQEWKCQMQTVSVKAADFLEDNPSIDLSRITSIALVFEGSGEIYLDNVGLE